MKVSISPWKVTKTSLHVDTAKRKRSRHTNGNGSKENGHAFSNTSACAARFVAAPSQQRRKKLVHEENFVPHLVVTSEHNTLVMGKPRGSGVEDLLSESRTCNYSSRPSKTSSFLCSGRHAPVVLDPNSEIFYGLQNENKSLISWRRQGGPEMAASAKLKGAAVDMQIISISPRQAFVYGSLDTGDIYLGYADGENLSVEVFASNAPKNALHVGTVATTSATDASVAGSKRKSQSVSNMIEITQILSSSQGFLLIKHTISVVHGGLTGVKRSQTINAELKTSSLTVTVATLVGINPTGTVVLAFSAKNDEQFYCCISLLTGSFVTAPIALPPDTKQVALTAGSVLLAVRAERIEAIDTCRSATVAFCNLPAENFLLLGDPLSPRFGCLFEDGGTISVGVSSFSGSHSASLSSMLQASTLLQSDPEIRRSSFARGLSLSAKEGQTSIEEASIKATETLVKARDGIFKMPKSHTISFVTVFDGVLKLFIDEASDRRRSSGKKSRKQQKNGTHVNGTKNGFHTPQSDFDEIPPQVPRSLISMLGKLAEDILCSRSESVNDDHRREASTVLKHVVRSSRCTSRFIFDLLEVLISLSSLDGTAYSPMQFAFDILQHCSDVSEQQAVSIVGFAVKRASTEDMVHILDSTTPRHTKLLNQYKSDSSGTGLPQKIIVAGVLLTLDQIMIYSDTNKSLFRSAIDSMLTRAEVCFVLELVLQMNLDSKSHSYSRMLDFLLCFSESLTSPLAKAEAVVVEKLRKRIVFETEKAEAISNLSDLVHRVSTRPNSKKQKGNAVAPYQIERLVI